MADEIAQVVEMEYKGAYYLFKGTKAMIAMMARFVKALHEWKNEKYLKKPGNCTWEKLQQVSNGTPPILEFPKEMFEEKVVRIEKDGTKIMKSDFDVYCEKYDLRYCIMPDLNPNDDYIPVAVPTQDMGIHQEQIKAVMGRRIKTEEEAVNEYDVKINAVKEQIANTVDSDEKAVLESQLTMLYEGKEQSEMLLSESKEKLERDNILDFAEYLKQGEGTIAEHDAEAALAEANICDVVREYMPKECMWPVRDEKLVPESKEIYYSQRTKDDQVHVIRREFLKDEHGQIYSKYFMKAPGAKTETMISDYGFSKEKWQEKLPEILKEGGFINEEPTAVVHGKDRFLKYQEFIEENFKKPQAEVKEAAEYSSKEAENFVKEHNRDEKQRSSYENSLYSVVTVPVTKIMTDEEQVMCMELSEGLLKGVMIDSMDSKEAHVFIRGDMQYSVKSPDGKVIKMSGEDILKSAEKSQVDAINKAARRGR